ncbi:hypothetical protein DXG01_008555 [Tephrocybe rancida]|nr:hypothetical protein DXG01_008555 [Tephrocybe rancida]
MATEIESRYLSLLNTLLTLVDESTFFGTTAVENACAAPINRLPVEVLRPTLLQEVPQGIAIAWLLIRPNDASTSMHALESNCPLDPTTLDQILHPLLSQATNHSPSSILIDMNPRSVPILESAAIMSRDAISLPCPPMDGGPPMKKVWETMYSSPMFKGGEWEVDYLEAPEDDMPWSRLTTVDVTMTSEALFVALKECSNLIILHYTDPFARFHRLHLPDTLKRVSPALPDSPITLPLLKKLSLVTETPADPMFQRLTLPSLTNLYVEQQRAWNVEPDPPLFNEFLNRSNCRLEK